MRGVFFAQNKTLKKFIFFEITLLYARKNPKDYV